MFSDTCVSFTYIPQGFPINNEITLKGIDNICQHQIYCKKHR